MIKGILSFLSWPFKEQASTIKCMSSYHIDYLKKDLLNSSSMSNLEICDLIRMALGRVGLHLLSLRILTSDSHPTTIIHRARHINICIFSALTKHIWQHFLRNIARGTTDPGYFLKDFIPIFPI